MSYFICNKCDEKHYLLGKGGGEKLSKEFDVKLLGQIPFDKKISENCDSGTPDLIQSNVQLKKIYEDITNKLIT